MVRPEVIAAEAVGVYTQVEILDAIQRGRVSLQFISPAQVDGHGTINTSRVRAADGTMRRLPGGLAHADIACLIGRLVAYRAGNDRRFLPAEVDFVTGAAGRIATIVTSAAVLDWDGERFALSSVHAGVTREEAVAGCGFALDAPTRCRSPSRRRRRRIRLLREEIDPHGMRRLETREGRAEALRELEAMS